MFRIERRRERFLAIYGPLSLLGLAAVWALGLLIGFAGLQWSAGSNLRPLSATRFIGDHWLLNLDAAINRLKGSPDVSPVTERRTGHVVVVSIDYLW